jgi:hypothetical protein
MLYFGRYDGIGIGLWAWRVSEAREPNESFIRCPKADLTTSMEVMRLEGKLDDFIAFRISNVSRKSSGNATLCFQSAELISIRLSAVRTT